MRLSPIRARSRPSGGITFVGDGGGFFSADEAFLDRLLDQQLDDEDWRFLDAEGHVAADIHTTAGLAHCRSVARRIASPVDLDYLILVPTLRCNLSCSYCQVSRAAIDRPGFDWSEKTTGAVLALIDGLSGPSVKIEFQGGEPTLRPDLIRRVIDQCDRFEQRTFVICTNLSRLDDEIVALFDRPDVFISTSLDGPDDLHERNRTGTSASTESFVANLDFVLKRYAASKVSALPTIDAASPPPAGELIDAFVARGFRSIFLRSIKFHGFARKRHADSREQDDAWRLYYEGFIRELIARNWDNRDEVVEETYFSLCLRRVFRPGLDRHVDLREPNPVGVDYVVIDHDGKVYPTDEARMLARSGVIDLAIGDVHGGWDTEARRMLNRHSTNRFDPHCMRCAYQPFCGRDVVDDIARYGTIDVQRPSTAFCQRHIHVFDLIFELIYSGDPAIRHSLNRWLKLPGDSAQLGAVLP